MKKFLISAAVVASFAAPALAQQADTAADPFVATQGTTELAVLGGVTLLILLAAASNSGEGSSSSGATGTPE